MGQALLNQKIQRSIHSGRLRIALVTSLELIQQLIGRLRTTLLQHQRHDLLALGRHPHALLEALLFSAVKNLLGTTHCHVFSLDIQSDQQPLLAGRHGRGPVDHARSRIIPPCLSFEQGHLPSLQLLHVLLLVKRTLITAGH